jgi:pimeloyl-ACP methyl ester carboxylesterase
MYPRDIRRLTRESLGLLACLGLAACQSFPPHGAEPLGFGLKESLRALSAPNASTQLIARVETSQRDLLAANLPDLLRDAANPKLPRVERGSSATYTPSDFKELTPVLHARITEPGLHRPGIGLPMVSRIDPGGPNAPRTGYRVPVTLVALPNKSPSGCCDVALVDPERIRSVSIGFGNVSVAMNLEAPLDALSRAGTFFGQGFANMLRADRFAGKPRIVFLEPFDPDKTPLLLVHGLMSTPRAWLPVIKALLADSHIRRSYQVWFFYYPTGKPIPLNALRLREDLDDIVRNHGRYKPVVIIGHSMGGILARSMVSGLTPDDAEKIVPGISKLPPDNLVRRALVFAPRTDVSRAVFMFAPHRGSWLASSGIGALGTRLIRLPATLMEELMAAAKQLTGSDSQRFPTSIQGLSPASPYLAALNRTRPTVPVHSIIGDRGRRGPLSSSSDGVVSYSSSHLKFAESELVIPTGHGGIANPLAINELKRILDLPERN